MSKEHPLVTFALFAYNQEQYIREAVEGALAQDYPNLEIILSDDCSRDRTFEIMREMVANYAGPHRVRLRRNDINLQTALHVQSVAETFAGELLVVAAGDDVSLPARVSLTVRAWLASERRASCIHGKLIEIDADSGQEVRRSGFRPGCDRTLELGWFVKNKGLPFFSPTCAYARRVFTNFPPMVGGSVIEDGVLVQRCFLEGPVVPVDDYLIRQRVNHCSSGRGFSIDEPAKWNRHMRSRHISAMTRLQDLASHRELDAATRSSLEREHLRLARRIPSFVLPLARKAGVLGRVVICLRLFMLYPSRASILGRLAFAVRFTHPA